MQTLAETLEELAATHKGFERVFKTVEYDWTEGTPLKGLFVYPGFTHGTPQIDALVDFLDRCLVDYCIPRKEVTAICPPGMHELANAQAVVDLREAFSDLKDRARRAFIRTRTELKKGGEAGEVILYTLLERLMKAPQLVSKMNLKTNSNQPNFGRDGVHVTFDKDTHSLILLMGESKLEKQFSKAVDHAIESVLGYLNDSQLREHEIDVVKSHMDLGSMPEEAQAELRALLNPYSGGPPQAGIVHACLLGFEANEYKKVAKLKPTEIEAAFKEAYLKRIKFGCNQVKSKVDAKLPPEAQMIFFLLPFPSLTALRQAFLQKIGMK